MKAHCDIVKWAQTWHQNLNPMAQLLYAYVWDVADEAGVWDVDIVEAANMIGSPIDEIAVSQIIEAKVAKYLEVDGKKFLWLTRYCEQYVTLSDKFFGHRKVIRLIRYYNLFEEPIIASLFRDGYQYTVDKKRKKLKLDEADKESEGERDMFNKLCEHGIQISWQNWRRLCQLCPAMDKNYVLDTMIEIIPIYLPNHMRHAGDKKPLVRPDEVWKMAVDIAEYSEQHKRYTGAIAESLICSWTGERIDTWHKKKEAKKKKESKK